MGDMDPELLAAYREALAASAAVPAALVESAPAPAQNVPPPTSAPADDASGGGGDLLAKFLAGAAPETHAAIRGVNQPTGDPDQRARQLLSKQYPSGMSAPEIQAKLAADKQAVGNAVGPASAFMSNLANGASLGWADELGGATNRLAGAVTGDPRSYAEMRDELRAQREAGAAQHPVVSGIGEFVGGALPAAAAGIPETLGKAVGLGVGLGAVSGAGNSDADPTSPQFAIDAAKGAGIGGLAGAAGYKLTKWINGAPEQLDNATMRKIVGRSGQGAQEEAEAARDNVLGALKEHPEVKAAVGKPKDLVAKARAALDVRNATGDAIYDDAAAVTHDAAQKAAAIEAERLNSLAEDAEHEAEVHAAKLPAIQKAIDRHSADAEKYVNEDMSAKATLKASKREVELAETKAAADASLERAKSLRDQAAGAVSSGASGGGVDTAKVAEALSGVAKSGYGQDAAAARMAKEFDALAAGRERIPGRELRSWVSNYLAPNTVDPESAMELAKQSARKSVRDVLHQHVEDALGADARAALEENNRHVNGLSTIADIAKDNARKEIYRPIQGQAFKHSLLDKVKLGAQEAGAAVAGSGPVQEIGGATIGGAVAGGTAAEAEDAATTPDIRLSAQAAATARAAQAKKLAEQAKQRIFGD